MYYIHVLIQDISKGLFKTDNCSHIPSDLKLDIRFLCLPGLSFQIFCGFKKIIIN